MTYRTQIEAVALRPLFYYILVTVSVAVIAMFFVSQQSRHVQIGYELNRLRRERTALQDMSRKLDFEISKAASHASLVETAGQLGLSLQPPLTTADRGRSR